MKDTCSECRFFGKNACSMNVTDPEHEKCGDFYRDSAKGKDPERQFVRRKLAGLCELGPYEAIYHSGKPAFLVKNGSRYEVTEALVNEGKTVSPKEANEFPYEPYGYYPGEVPNGEDLFWAVRNEFDLFLDIESIHKEFLAACVLLSYQHEKLRTVPYVFFYGDNESGKTVALTLLAKLCYRPMYGVTFPTADIFNYLEDDDAPGTIIEDEVQGLWKDLDKSKIYKAGYKHGAVVPRMLMLKYTRKIKFYHTFCFKACASEEVPRVKGLVERFIFIPMVEGFPKKDWADCDEDDLKRLRELRNLLLKWRLATRLDWQLPQVDIGVKGRLNELWKPVIQIVSGLTVEGDLCKHLEKIKEERMGEKTNTLEGHIVKVISKLFEPGKPILASDIWDTLVVELEGKLDDKKTNQMDTPEFGIVTKSRVGYRIREVFNAERKTIRTENGVSRCHEFNPDKAKRVFRKYGIKELVTKLPSEPSSRGVSMSLAMEKNHQNNVENAEKPIETLKELGYVGNSVTTSTVIAIVHLEPIERGTCALCQKYENLTWQIQYANNEWANVCLSCGSPIYEKFDQEHRAA